MTAQATSDDDLCRHFDSHHGLRQDDNSTRDDTPPQDAGATGSKTSEPKSSKKGGGGHRAWKKVNNPKVLEARARAIRARNVSQPSTASGSGTLPPPAPAVGVTRQPTATGPTDSQPANTTAASSSASGTADATMAGPSASGAAGPMPTAPTTAAGASSSNTPAKRRADGPPDDPRVQNTDQPQVVTPQGTKRPASTPPDDPRTQNTDMPDLSSAERFRLKCATCSQDFGSRNALHRHLKAKRHQWRGAPPNADMMQHFARSEGPNHHDIGPKGSTVGWPPGTDETGFQQLSEQDASRKDRQIAEVSKPSIAKSHPGPKVSREELESQDLKWRDVGSGVMSRVFIGAERFITTTRKGPPMEDVKTRRTWSLTTGKLIDEVDVENTPDRILNRPMKVKDDIRVELTLKGAMAMYERRGPDVAELFSQPRICQEAGGISVGGSTLRPGWSLDLTMNDPATDKPWDLSKTDVQERVRRLVRTTKPYCVVGSPPCTAFSPLQEISRAKRDPKEMEKQLRRAKAHVRFCLEIYRIQLEEQRHFVHEHPERSRAWQMPEVIEFLMRPEVGSVICHMCAFGMTSEDKKGRGLVQKATRIMSSSEEILKRLDVKCSNKNGNEKHRHVHLEQGRAKQAQVYPRQFCKRVCEGIMAQKRKEELGVTARPVMSFEEMNEVAKGAPGDCPGAMLHEDDGEGWIAIDDVTGQRLDPKLMRAARKDEIAYFRKMGVYEKVDVKESWQHTGKAPIAVRWVDINKGDTDNPNYRSRLVAKEFNTGVCPELYAATPPSECLRLMLSMLASTRKQGTGLMYADVSRAYFYAPAKRPVYVKLPDEDFEPGDEGKCGKLLMSMYGTRDAALNWSIEYSQTLMKAGFVQGRGNSCLFHNKERKTSVMVHGDDFIGVGPEDQLAELRSKLEEKYKIKVERLGLKEGEKAEIRILNKVVRETSEGIELEADPRHVEIAIRELGIEQCKAANTPGCKENSRAEVNGKKMSQNDIRKRLRHDDDNDDDGRPVEAISEAKESAGANDKWECREEPEEQTGQEKDELLGPAEARLYRGVAARFNYIAPDRADIAYAVKETARSMSAPKASDLRKLRRLGKYLIGRPRLVMKFRWQDMPSTITTFTDSDWAGCLETAKSTSGGALCLGEHVIKTYSKQQKVVALSSAEAELYAMVAASTETLGLQAYARDLGLDMKCELYCDSAAALGIAQRAGIGKVRHLRTQGLWVQEVRISGRIQYRKVLGEKNPADLLTKFMPAELSMKHLKTLNMELTKGRAESAPTLDSVQMENGDVGKIESVVNGWYIDYVEQAKIAKVVRFHGTVHYKGIPSRGRARKTPPRGSRASRIPMTTPSTTIYPAAAVRTGGVQSTTDDSTDDDNHITDMGQEELHDDGSEKIEVKMHECQSGGESWARVWGEIQRSRPRWADVCDDSDEDVDKPVMSIETENRQRQTITRARSAASAEEESLRESDRSHRRGDDILYSSFYFNRHFCSSASETGTGASGSAKARQLIGASGSGDLGDRLPSRHLEGGCLAPNVRGHVEFARRNASSMSERPSVKVIGRRRSVRGYCHTHASAGAHVQTCMFVDLCVHALPCSHARTEELQAHVFPLRLGSSR